MTARNANLCYSKLATGMAGAVLAEIAERLQELSAGGAGSVIDLRSLPLTEADREQLEAALGRGEVVAELQIAGRSTVRETAYAGAWWIRHRGANDRVSSEEIAVCPIPEILASHPADIESAALRLKEDLLENHSSQAEASNG